MNENTKKFGLIAVVVVAVCAAAFSIYSSMSEPKEEIVGTIDFGPGGGKASEMGGNQSGGLGGPPGNPPAADPASGMPAEMAGGGSGKQ